MSRRSTRSDVMYTKEELERMKFWELKNIAKKRNLSRRFTTKHDIIDSLLNFELEANLSLETLTLVNLSESEQDSSSKEIDKTSPMQTRQKNIPQSKKVARRARRRFSKPRMTVFQLYNTEDESNVTSVNDELQKGNGKYFETLWTSDMINSPEVSLNKSTAIADKKSITGYSETLITPSPYPTRNRRSTINPIPFKSARRSRRTKTKELSKRDVKTEDDTFSKNPSVDLTDTEHQLEEEKGSEESKPVHTRRRFSKPRMTVFQLYNTEDESNVTSVNDELQKDNGKYFETLWTSDMMNSPEVSLNKSTAIAAKKIITGYSETLVTPSQYPTRNRRSTINPIPFKSARRSRRTKTKELSKRDVKTEDDTFSKNPSVDLTDTEDQLEEEKGSEESKPVHNFVIDLGDKVNNYETSRVKSSRDRRKRSKFYPEIVMKEDFVKDGLQNHESEFPQSAVTPFEETQTSQSGRKLRSRVTKAYLSPSPVKEAEAVEVESPKLNETFEIDEEINNINSSKVNSQQRGNGVTFRKLRKSLRTSTKMLPSKELETSKIQDKSENKENESAVDLKLNGTYELPKEDLKLNNTYELSIGKDTSLSVLKEGGNSVKRRSRSFPRETTKTIEKNFFSPTKSIEESLKRSQKKGTFSPLKRTRIPVPKSVKKMPDFQNIHKKEFEKMESLVDNHERKLQRARKLISPCKVGVMVFKGAQPSDKKNQFQKPATQGSSGFRFNLQDRFIPQMNIKAQIAPPPVKYFIQKQNVRDVKDMVTKKLPVHNRRESIRQESRTKIKGVRLNRRFELQMAHRKIN